VELELRNGPPGACSLQEVSESGKPFFLFWRRCSAAISFYGFAATMKFGAARPLIEKSLPMFKRSVHG